MLNTPVSYHLVRNNLSTGSLTCSDLVDSFLQKIEESKENNWFVEVYAEEARQRASEIDEKLQTGTAGRLAGMVIGVKDVIAYQGHGLQAASTILDGFVSEFTATALQRVLEEDAIVIGRQNCDEFAMGSSNEHGKYGPASNPHDADRVPGGSSGASAAAVAAGCCHASLGSDTGGSVRQPASFCGVVGLKPTYGRVSRWGLIAYASSFDQIGPVTNSVEDAELLLEIMSGPDGKDHTLSPTAVPFTISEIPKEAKPLKIGVIQETMSSAGLQPEIHKGMEELMSQLKKDGHSVSLCSFPLLPHLVPCYYILTTAEASSNLNRFDGVHYGRRAEGVTELIELYKKSRTEGLGAEVQKRIMLGSFVLSEGHVDAYFTHAQRIRQKITDDTMALFGDYDILISPTSPTVAFKRGEKLDDPVTMYLSDVFTVHANLVGAPAISIPLGQDRNGLPFGLQLMAAPWQEAMLMQAAKRIQPQENLAE